MVPQSPSSFIHWYIPIQYDIHTYSNIQTEYIQIHTDTYRYIHYHDVFACMCMYVHQRLAIFSKSWTQNRYIQIHTDTYRYIRICIGYIHNTYVYIQIHRLKSFALKSKWPFRRDISFHRWHIMLDAFPLARQSVSLSVHHRPRPPLEEPVAVGPGGEETWTWRGNFEETFYFDAVNAVNFDRIFGVYSVILVPLPPFLA